MDQLNELLDQLDLEPGDAALDRLQFLQTYPTVQLLILDRYSA